MSTQFFFILSQTLKHRIAYCRWNKIEVLKTRGMDIERENCWSVMPQSFHEKYIYCENKYENWLSKFKIIYYIKISILTFSNPFISNCKSPKKSLITTQNKSPFQHFMKQQQNDKISIVEIKQQQKIVGCKSFF